MANDARGGLSPEDAERFASAIRPLWDSMGPEAAVAGQTQAHGPQPQVPPAAPSGPRELFGSTPDDSILGMSPSAHYKATRASQPPMNEVILPRLDRTLVMNSPTPPAAVAAIAAPAPMPAPSPFTRAPGLDANANHGIVQTDLRLSTPPPPPVAGNDAYLMDDVLPKRGGGKNVLFVLAILAGVGVGGVLALRFIGTTSTPTPVVATPSARAIPSATEATVIATPPATASASAIVAPTAAPSATVVTSAPASASASAAPVASASTAPAAPATAARAPAAAVGPGPRVPDVSFVGPSSGNTSASKPQPQAKPPAVKPETPKPTAAPKGTGGGIVRDAPF